MPLDFGQFLPGHEVHHIESLGLKGTKNGALISLARAEYDALVTLDRGILFQHNHSNHNLKVIVIRVKNSGPETVRNRAPEVLVALESSKTGSLVELT